MRNKERRIPGRFRAVVYALMVHAAVAAVVVVGFRWTSAPVAAPSKAIQAVAVNEEQARRSDVEKRKQDEDARKKAQLETEATEQKRKEEEERKRAEDKRKLEEQRKAEEQRKLEDQRRAEQERKQAEAEKKKQAEAKKKQDEEQRKQAAVEKKREETAAKQKKQEDDQRRKAAEDSLKEDLKAEEHSRAEAAKVARAATEADKYKALIRQKVSRNWNQPHGAAPGLKCVVRVRLVPGGEVLEAHVIKGSGNAAFDRSVEAAVFKASPLPLPTEADLFEYFREVEFTFSPT